MYKIDRTDIFYFLYIEVAGFFYSRIPIPNQISMKLLRTKKKLCATYAFINYTSIG